jgi:hypothetical protein
MAFGSFLVFVLIITWLVIREFKKIADEKNTKPNINSTTFT